MIVDYGRWKIGSCFISWPRGAPVPTGPLDRRWDVDHGGLSKPLDLEAPERVDKGWLWAGDDVARGRAVKAAIFVQLQAGELPLR